MTDVTGNAPSQDEQAGRALVARTTFEKEAVWLPMLAVHHWNAGEMTISGKTFTDCVIEGPAVIAIMTGTTFDSCAMGNAKDPRTLLLRPVGDTISGVVGMANCRFVRCRFVQIGYTGGDELLAVLERDISATNAGMGAAPAG